MGELLGTQMQPRDIAAGLWNAGFKGAQELSDAVKVCLSESQGYTKAYNFNKDDFSQLKSGQKVRNVETLELYTVVDPAKGTVKEVDGTVLTMPLTVEFIVSKDVGVMQINIPVENIGTGLEDDLYDPDNNFAKAYALYQNRGFQPWVAYTTNVYLRDTYVKRANKGVANWLSDLDLKKTPTDTLNEGNPYVHTLTTPMFDYMYRVVTQHNAILAIQKETKKTSPSIATIRSLVNSAVNLYKS